MGNLFTRRAIAFLLAVALAIVAALAVFNYLRSVEQEAAELANEVELFVATERIEPGTLADTAIQLGLIVPRDVPADLQAPDAITELDQITNRVVEEVILPGDQILSTRFTAPGQSTNVLTIPPDHQAMSFAVGVEPGVAGFLRAGDFVSLIVNVTAEGQDTGAPTGGDTADAATDDLLRTQQRVQYLLQDIEILALGRRVPPTEENPAGTTVQGEGGLLLTVAVLPDEAEKLAYAVQNGSVWLTLLPEDEREPVTTPGRTSENLFDD